jgi:minor extracellular serine protease Vpr
VVQFLPSTQTFQVQNNGGAAVDLGLTIIPRTADANATLSLDHSSLTLAPGQSAQFTVSLNGSMPAAGSYEGIILLQGDTVTLRIPYLYLVSDGIPNSLVPLLGRGGTGQAGKDVPDGMLAFEVVDQFGLPVPNVPVSFAVLQGRGEIVSPDAATNVYGIATAEAIMGPTQSNNVFSATAAGKTVQFADTGVLQPVISDNGVVNAASFLPGPGIAPGSYVSVFGANLSLGGGGATTTNLPVSIRSGGASVSVSFDVPEANRSVAGHLIYVSPRQVNVQVPWELRGQTSARMKVSIENASGAVFTVPVADYSPGIFSYSSGGQNLAVAQDASSAPVTTDHPAIRGQIVTLYGTGFGPVNHTPASGDPAPDSSATTIVVPMVTVGGVQAPVQFSGLAPGYAGLYQVNVTVPAGAPQGLQPLAVSANGIAASTVLLPIQ